MASERSERVGRPQAAPRPRPSGPGRPLLHALALAAALVVAGCFNPKLEPGFACGDDPPGPQCPSGFFCDDVTYTCLRDGTPPTRAGVSLGQAFPGLVAARLGDGVVVAGWFLNPARQPEFQVHRYRNDGTMMFPVSVQPLFDGVERTSLRAAGAQDVAVIVGRAPGTPDRLLHLWVYGNKEAIEPTDLTEPTEERAVTAYGVTASPRRACFLRAYPGSALTRGVDLVCRDGITDDSRWQNALPSARPLGWATATVTDDPSDDAVFVESPAIVESGVSRNQLWAFCAGQGSGAVSVGKFRPQGGDDDLLRPQARRGPNGVEMHLGWIEQRGLQHVPIEPTCIAGEVQTFAGPVKQFAAAGGPPGGSGSLFSLSLRGDPLAPLVEDWRSSGEEPVRMEPLHPFLANPHALNDTRDNTWFLFYASDEDERQGWVKGLRWHRIDEPALAIGSDSGTVTADFAAAPRMSGGFFLVTRDNPENVPLDEALETLLAPIDANLELLVPPLP